ncbi:hypothetical protein Hanom_Chr10g00923251 [Helianthus anomalus]
MFTDSTIWLSHQLLRPVDVRVRVGDADTNGHVDVDRRRRRRRLCPILLRWGSLFAIFPRGTAAYRFLGRLREMTLDAPQTIDIQFLTDIGSIGRVREFMPANSAWDRLFDATAELAHMEITFEFLCTFSFKDT